MKPYVINTWTLFFLLNLMLTISLEAQSGSEATSYGNNKNAGNFIAVNGIKLYYEIYGEGAPLVLIHGNGGNIAYMKPQIEYFSKNYKVIVMDCRGRGKSELGKDSLTYMQMTKDIIGLLNSLHLDSTYVIGRSHGGIIALLMAIYYPDKSQNWYVIQQQNRLMEFQPHISANDLHKIKCPVLILSCDRDLIPEEHTLFIYRNIPKANLCIFTGENHFVTKNNPILFNTAVAKYFSEPFKGEELRHGD